MGAHAARVDRVRLSTEYKFSKRESIGGVVVSASACLPKGRGFESGLGWYDRDH